VSRPVSTAKSIVIVGGGVIGLGIAHYALERGHRVTILERGAEEHDGCSFGNAGLIVPSHFVPLAAPGMVALGLKWMWSPESPFHVKPRLSGDLLGWGWRFWRASTASRVRAAAPLLRDLNLASRACFEEIAARTGNAFGLETRGLLVLVRSEHALEEEARTAETARRLGIPAEVLSAGETARLEPGIRMDIAGSVYFPRDCHLEPRRFMEAMRDGLDRAGAAFSWSTEVTGWRAGNGRIDGVETTRGGFTADEYVIAGGAWSARIARELGVRLPIQAGKGYSLTLERPRAVPAIPCLLSEARVAVTPMGSALRFGGTMEIAGLDESINAARVRGIIKSAARYFPDYGTEDFRGVAPWCGLRPCSPDGLPYVGRTRSFSNLVIATGHAMMGLSLGPITGKLVAETISGEAPSIDIQPLNPDRYN
jgi:D-amino-acid dehydrogenase